MFVASRIIARPAAPIAGSLIAVTAVLTVTAALTVHPSVTFAPLFAAFAVRT
jgi:hypothetical protein